MFIVKLKPDTIITVVSSFEIRHKKLFVRETMHEWGPPPITTYKLENVGQIKSSNGDVLFDEGDFNKIIKNYEQLFGKEKENK